MPHWRRKKKSKLVRLACLELRYCQTLFGVPAPGTNTLVARAVRKANKDLAELVNSREDSFAKVEIIQQKYSDLLHDMKKLEREHTKARKRADQLQKEKDQSRAEMTKAVQLKGKLETLCRELQKENKRIKVATFLYIL